MALKTQNKHLREGESLVGNQMAGPTVSEPVSTVANTAVIIAVARVRSV